MDPLETLIDILPLPALLARTDDDVIVHANGLLARALGVRLNEPVGGPTSALFYSPADRDHCRGAIVRDGRIGDYELQLRRFDGRPFWAVLWAASVKVAGRPAELLTFYDSTAAAQTELLNCRLKAMAIHEREMQTLGTVTAGIAHDLNNIIKPLVSYSDLALRHVPPGSRAYSGLEQVVEAAQHARVLARQILSFSRQDGGRGEALRLQPIIEELVAELYDTLPDEIEIRTAVDEDCPSVRGEAGELRQVLANLCSNAVFAMRDEGGRLDVELTAVDVDVSLARSIGNLAPGSYACLTVRDSGHGMCSDLLERAFDSSAGDGPGAAVARGLSAAHGVVVRHGGEIVVRGEEGKGTTVRAFLPQADNDASVPEPADVAAARGNERLLVVEDREELAGVLERMLGRLGYRVTIRTRPADALQMFREEPTAFDVVVTDQSMPEMTGAELAGELRRIRSDLPIILISGFKDAAIEQCCRQIGVRELIMKPIVGADVGRAIRRALDGPTTTGGQPRR
jgi:signal transduction histidine kinase/ActR/RegA family two-component response regulator